MSTIPMPPSVKRAAVLDPELGEHLELDFSRLMRASEALVWAQERLPALVEATGPSAVLQLLVDEAKQLTDAPGAWAVTWKGDIGKGQASFRALAGGEGDAVPTPGEISRTIVATVVDNGRPAWSDDAASDARFTASHSVQSFTLRSVGCLPLGKRGVLYLHDADHPARFGPTARARLSALCKLATPFLDRSSPSGAAKRPKMAAESIPGVVGRSAPMVELFAMVRAFAPMPWAALILGETGTGKELVAKAMHELSTRSRAPFVAVNCGAIPDELAESTLFGHERGAFTGADRRKEGMVERVRDGTLFLDEVGELSPRVQVKLLRLLQEGTYEKVGGERALPFRGRVLAATHRNIDHDEDRGEFREDLFHRLSACVIRVPPLRDRRDDISVLAQHLLAQTVAELPGTKGVRLTDEALADLRGRSWPGNVRELQNVLRGAVARSLAMGGGRIEPDHLVGATRRRSGGAGEPGAITDLQEATEAFQKQMVRRALASTDGNRTKAAESLGVSRQWLHRLISRWPDFE